MPKINVLHVEHRLQNVVTKWYPHRRDLTQKLIILNKKTCFQLGELEILLFTFFYIINKVQQLPKSSILSRIKNRCWKTGRSRGVSKFLRLSRNALKSLSNAIMLPGIIKSSW